jgi:hypothetical protein
MGNEGSDDDDDDDDVVVVAAAEAVGVAALDNESPPVEASPTIELCGGGGDAEEDTIDAVRGDKDS